MAKIKKLSVPPRFNRNQSISGWHQEERGYECAFLMPAVERHHPFVPDAPETAFFVDMGTVLDAMRGVERMHVSAAEGAYAIVRKILFSFDDPRRDELKEKLNRLYGEWREQTGHLSRMDQRVTHMAYLSIIGMGPEAVPLILEKMQEKPGEWFLALQAITGDNPVTEESRGIIPAMTEAWLNWGRERGYIAQRPRHTASDEKPSAAVARQLREV